MDFHLSWFRQRLAKLFGIPDGLEYVDVLINDNYERLKRFFDGDFSGHTSAAQQLEERILFVYRTFYDRLVEKEITVLEEVPHVATPEPEPTKEKRKRGRGGGGKADGGGGKEKQRARGDLKDEDAEVKLDRDFLLDGNTSSNAPAAGIRVNTVCSKLRFIRNYLKGSERDVSVVLSILKCNSCDSPGTVPVPLSTNAYVVVVVAGRK